MCNRQSGDAANVNSVPNPFAAVAGTARGIASDVIAISLNKYKVPVEPRLMPYVCAKGLSLYC
jgi:hypothetical protein